MVAIAVLIPTAVPFFALILRVGGDGGEALDVLWAGRTLELVGNTVALVAAVSASAAVIGIGAAWLTSRTDLRWRRGWSVVAALPLVIPSYVIALAMRSAFGPRGLLADLTGDRIPDRQRIPGCLAGAHHRHLPLRVPGGRSLDAQDGPLPGGSRPWPRGQP